MVLTNWPIQVGSEVLPQKEEFKYLGVLFMSEEKMEWEMIGAASVGVWTVPGEVFISNWDKTMRQTEDMLESLSPLCPPRRAVYKLQITLLLG